MPQDVHFPFPFTNFFVSFWMEISFC